ncbi:MAG: cytidylate kinase [Nanohaloarchaea archaeon SW_7_43_1]|nr:MAG: cytidylate kinase [Nanohaloarchaea archaeon SW_7_43_1]
MRSFGADRYWLGKEPRTPISYFGKPSCHSCIKTNKIATGNSVSMGSYIEDFQGDRERNSDIIITIDGMAATGKGTLAEFIADKLDLKHFSASDVFYEVAEERGLEDHELSEEAEKELDLEIDRRTVKRALSQDCVVEGRIPSHALGDYSDLRTKVTAGLEERAGRLAKREDIDRYEASQVVKKRDREDSRRYSDYYNIDTDNKEIYDLIIDNSELGIEEQNQLVDKVLKQEFTERYEED